jgi:hypothetical protein
MKESNPYKSDDKDINRLFAYPECEEMKKIEHRSVTYVPPK